jgi:hypothetical protein
VVVVERDIREPEHSGRIRHRRLLEAGYWIAELHRRTNNDPTAGIKNRSLDCSACNRLSENGGNANYENNKSSKNVFKKPTHIFPFMNRKALVTRVVGAVYESVKKCSLFDVQFSFVSFEAARCRACASPMVALRAMFC